MFFSSALTSHRSVRQVAHVLSQLPSRTPYAAGHTACVSLAKPTTRTLTLSRAYNDMRLPPIANINPQDYKLCKVQTEQTQESEAHHPDDLALDSWPGDFTPKLEPKPFAEALAKGSVDFDANEAQRLMNDVNEAIVWLAQAKPLNVNEQKEADRVQAKVLDVIDHYASQFWLPLILERFTPVDWSTVAQNAALDPAVAHFLSLLCAQLSYTANSPDYFRLQRALTQMRDGGIRIDGLQSKTPLVPQCDLPQIPSHDTVPENPVVGYFLRYAPKDVDPQYHYWIIGLAGTQTATMSSNLRAHFNPILVANRHSGYNQYYQKVIKPALVQRLTQMTECEGSAQIPATIHFSGHSMGGALAHYAALDFPPTEPSQSKDANMATKPLLVIHSNNSARAGNHELRRELMSAGAQCVTSTHVDDIVTTVPPNFFGYDNTGDDKLYNTPFHEARDKMGLLSKNWREGFVRHRLAVFLIMFAPAPIRQTFLRHGLILPTPDNYQTLGYKISKQPPLR